MPDTVEKTDYEKQWDEFWKDLLIKNGKLDMDQIKREMFDFSNMMDSFGKVMDHVTGGMVSKPNTDPDVICGLADEHYEKWADDDFKDRFEEKLDEMDMISPEAFDKVVEAITDDTGPSARLKKVMELTKHVRAGERQDLKQLTELASTHKEFGPYLWDVRNEIYSLRNETLRLKKELALMIAERKTNGRQSEDQTTDESTGQDSSGKAV